MLNGLGPFRQIKAARPPGSDAGGRVGFGGAGVACPTRSACLFRSELIKRLTISIKVFNTSVLLHLSVFFFPLPAAAFFFLSWCVPKISSLWFQVSGFSLSSGRLRERERGGESSWVNPLIYGNATQLPRQVECHDGESRHVMLLLLPRARKSDWLTDWQPVCSLTLSPSPFSLSPLPFFGFFFRFSPFFVFLL